MKYLYRDLDRALFFNHFVRAREWTDTIVRQQCIFATENLDFKTCLFATGHDVQSIICRVVIFLINRVGRVSQPHVFIHVVTQFRILVMKMITSTKKERQIKSYRNICKTHMN